jgi:hypothetical protein
MVHYDELARGGQEKSSRPCAKAVRPDIEDLYE